MMELDVGTNADPSPGFHGMQEISGSEWQGRFNLILREGSLPKAWGY